MSLRRGFRKLAREITLEVRDELGVGVFAPLDPYALAELYGIEVLDTSHPCLPPESVRHFTEKRPHVFSGALVPLRPSGALIIENHVHHPRRRRATIAHEMAHVLLEHPFGLTLTDADGCRAVAPEIEEEATELSGELLVPTDAARLAAFRRWSDQAVATHFRVSLRMARWRMNVTGARRVAARTWGKRLRAHAASA
ncbi:ImmA/IrrE family metallo-endopeptidase [Amycolatopsis pigmentata]|uniref:ImmA/IrrE family metallo-endopeptidase n=1 Tax=Amycolatopsis pigmentata TaxID=450801 RepID=A0ABW5FWX7_9PSEU